jgi:uncharacterized protein with von Willebrand factor type A (vWA) domain
VNNLSANIAAFCALLRAEHGFGVGHAEARDALRALETVGVGDEGRVRTALRLVCCGTRDETLVFDRAFDRFFRPAAAGVAQPEDRARHTRPSPAAPPRAERAAQRPAAAAPERPVRRAPSDDEGDAARTSARVGSAAETSPPDAAAAWRQLRARYSPAAAAATPPQLDGGEVEGLLGAADRLIAGVRLGRSRRWERTRRGGRFDLRRTIRASLQTGGEPLELRFLGHPLRNPRFVVLIDGSRSMAERTGPIVHLARALCERSNRVNVFVFSTELRDVTREIRAPNARTTGLGEIGDAWGGGTRIGANFARFAADYGTRLLSPDTVVIIFSDGLDGGDVSAVEHAMRTIDRRCAAVVWLNPHAGDAGYRPTARAMRAALPFVTLFTAANDARGFAALAERLAVHPRIAGRRRR